jgi:tetratricopeptide (TPR) repeat protein
MNNKSGMKLRRQYIMFLLIIATGSSSIDLLSQNVPEKPSRQSSMEAFSKGNFEQAYKEFSVLLQTYSKDPIYKYYSGVCLVKLNRDPSEAESLLKQAIQSSALIRTLPAEALFYLGRAQQMGGKFKEAIGSYNLYTERVGKKVAREYKVPDFIQQCNGNSGKVAEELIIPVEAAKSEKNVVQKIEDKPVLKDTVFKPVVKVEKIRNELPAGYEKILDEALEFQIKADSLNTLLAEQKKRPDQLPPAEENALKAKISENETTAASFQKAADQKYSEAQAAMNAQSGNRIIRIEPVIKSDTKPVNKNVIVPDDKIFEKTDNKKDTTSKAVPLFSKPVEIFTLFEVLPRPAIDSNEKIKINPVVPEGLIYRIQVAVFRNPVAPSYFKGITPVYGLSTAGADKINYYVGMFRRSADAIKALSTVRSKGFKDAFVVPLEGNKPVSAEKAAVLEKEWGKRPLNSLQTPGSQILSDTIPPALTFRVQVIRSPKPVKDDAVEGMRKIAGARGLDILPLDDGNIAYLIGKFITFESAAEYSDLLIRNGYREAKVVAWLGLKEIPTATARQLFDNMK